MTERHSNGGRAPGPGAIDWPRTLLSRQSHRHGLQRRVRYRSGGHLLLLLIDASGSTLRGGGLQQAKGLVGGLARSAYRQRWRLALLSFAGQRVDTVFAAARAPFDGARLLAQIQGGGGTPLALGLQQAEQLLQRERRRFPTQRQTLLVLTDGRCRSSSALSPLATPGGGDQFCDRLLIDTEQGPVRLGRARQLAGLMGARYVRLAECAKLEDLS